MCAAVCYMSSSSGNKPWEWQDDCSFIPSGNKTNKYKMEFVKALH